MALCRPTLNKALQNQIRSIQISSKKLKKDDPITFSTKLDEEKERLKNKIDLKEDRFIFDASKNRLEVAKSNNKNLKNVSFQFNTNINDETNVVKNILKIKPEKSRSSIEGIREALLNTEFYKNYNKNKKRKDALKRFTKNETYSKLNFKIYCLPFDVVHKLLVSINKLLK